jgi:3'-phosphoadenosine 5'-phosphosulfate sulfotransferase
MTNEDIRRAVEEVAVDALREGRARLRLVEWGVELAPESPSACPVSLEIQSEEEVSLYVGRYGTTVDIYDPDPGSLLATLKEYVAAIIEGRYEEEVRLAETQENVLGKARGVFHLDRGDQEHRYSHVPSLGRRGPWQRLTYGAY